MHAVVGTAAAIQCLIMLLNFGGASFPSVEARFVLKYISVYEVLKG